MFKVTMFDPGIVHSTQVFTFPNLARVNAFLRDYGAKFEGYKIAIWKVDPITGIWLS